MDRPSSIPKRAIPSPKIVKRNAPITLRGTRSSFQAQDAYTLPPGRTPITSFNVPVALPPVPRDPSSRTASSSAYPHSGRSVSNSNSEADLRFEKKLEEIEDEESDPEDTALSPGFSRIAELLEAEPCASTFAASAGPGNNAAAKYQGERSSPSRSDKGNESPHDITERNDSTMTPRPSARNISISSRNSDGSTEMPKTASALRSTSTIDTWRMTRDTSLPQTPTRSLPQDSSGPYAILRELEALLGPATVAETIDLPRILCAHDACPSPSTPPPLPEASVFGVPLCIASHYASCSTILGGQTHMLPIVVFAAIEELYRAGLTSPRLLRPAGTSNGTTLPSLVATFDGGPTYGDGIDLFNTCAQLDDVSALLLTYLSCLPGPIIPRALLPALRRLVPTSNVQAGQLLLRLLPAPHFSLLVYLLAFFSQLPRYKDANGWDAKEIAKAFARVVCGAGEGCEGLLRWLVQHWDTLSMELFPGAVFPSPEDDLDARIAALERQHAEAVRAAYEAGAAAERKTWVVEVEALRETSEREGRILRSIVKRFAKGAPSGVR